MAETVANVKSLGRCRADFDSVDLGIVQNAEVTFEKVTHEVKIDAYNCPIDAVDGGWAVSVEFDMLEADVNTIIPKLQGFAKETGTYVSGTDTLTATRVTVGGVGGTAASTGVLKLVSSITAMAAKQIRFYKAFLSSCSPKIVYDAEAASHSGFRVKFVALADTTKSDGALLAAYGDFSDD